MNITQEKTGDLTVTLKMEVSESDYSEKYISELKNHRRKASMPGFRPGKVPMGLIRQKFGTAILLEEVNKLVSEKLNAYIADNKLDLLGSPLANTERDPQDFSRQKDFNFYFDLGLSPEVKIDFKEYSAVDYFKIIVDEDIITTQVDGIRKRSGKPTEQDEVEKDDMIHVKIDELNEDGKIREGGISNSTIVLTSFIKKQEILDQVIGSKVGDVVIFNPLDASGNSTETAAMLGIEKEAAKNMKNDFQFEITKIERNIPAELGEELYKLAFPKDAIKSEEEFFDKVRGELMKANEAESNRLFARTALDKLFDETEINLPDEFLKKWLFVSNEGKISMEEIEKGYDGYNKAMKMEILEKRLIALNSGLKISDDDVKTEIKNYFKGYFLPNQENSEVDNPAMVEQLEEIANNYLEKNKEETKKIYNELFNRRLSEFLKSEMTLLEKDVTHDEFVKEISKYSVPSHDHETEVTDDQK